MAASKITVAMYPADGPGNDGLIWSSEVKIEVISDAGSSIYDGDSSVLKQTADTERLSESSNHSVLVASRSTKAPSSTGEDADDEGSIYIKSSSPELHLPSYAEYTGRARSRTRQPRRLGIELSRDIFNIPSHSHNAQEQGIWRFGDAVHEQMAQVQLSRRWAPKSTIDRQIIEDVRNIKRQLARNFRSSVSRGRQNGRRNSPQDPDEQDAGQGDEASPQQQYYTRR